MVYSNTYSKHMKNKNKQIHYSDFQGAGMVTKYKNIRNGETARGQLNGLHEAAPCPPPLE